MNDESPAAQNTVPLVYALAAIDALLLLGALLLALWRAVFVARAKRASGEVIALSDDSGEFPVVRFALDERAGAPATTVTVRSDTSAGGVPIGTPVPMLYDPRAPQRARIAKAWHLWGASIVLTLIGAIFLAAAFTLYARVLAPAA